MKAVLIASMLLFVSCADHIYNSTGTLISYTHFRDTICQPYQVCVGIIEIDRCYSGVGMTEEQLASLIGKKVLVSQHTTGTGFNCSRKLTIKEIK